MSASGQALTRPASTAGKAPASTAGKAPAKTVGAKAGKKSATKKAAAPAADGEKKKRKKARKETYSSYIYKVLKQVHWAQLSVPNVAIWLVLASTAKSGNRTNHFKIFKRRHVEDVSRRFVTPSERFNAFKTSKSAALMHRS
ncbi:hypothetical protein C8F04DRAFT_1255772 [Mycena alexandri]|uniref:Histone H2B n=1 Tax=Mycena alexandri TaxID=1745969 RepID=A0AAD6T2C8_9AGAR|nr:hypothetical protein C8F04DRAFT_1255772 [Mycena alexandri]